MLDVIRNYWVQWLMGLLAAFIMWTFRRIMSTIRKQDRTDKALQRGLQAMLRDRILQAHDYYCNKGSCPVYARESIAAMYAAYHGLGGNGVITHMVEEIQNLPTGNNNALGR